MIHFFPFWQLCIVKGCCCGNDNEEDDDDEGDEDGDEGDDDEGDDGDSTEKQVSFRGRANWIRLSFPTISNPFQGA